MELTFFPSQFIDYDTLSAVHETLFSRYQIINQLIFQILTLVCTVTQETLHA
jgi:hypothetical protein